MRSATAAAYKQAIGIAAAVALVLAAAAAARAAPLRVTGPGPLKLVGAGRYRGSLEFRPGGSGGLETVDAVGLDDYDLTVAAAAAKLGKWVKGGLVGIRITKHGSSPRILGAVIVGTKGSTTVTGIQLQRAFMLLTTYAAFTTIVTAPGRASSGGARSAGEPSGGRQSQAVSALVPLVHDVIGTSAGLHGTIFPPRKGRPVAIQRATPRGWRTVLHTRLGAGGGYHTALPGPGRYRIVVGGLAGPAVTVS